MRSEKGASPALSYLYSNQIKIPMASIKVKLRPSSVKDREGTLFYQIIHKRQVRQIYTEIHICEDEWDSGMSSVIVTPGTDMRRKKYLEAAMDTIHADVARLTATVATLESGGLPYSAGDVVKMFNTPSAVVGIVSFTRRLIVDLNRIGKNRAAKRLGVSLNSLLRYTGGDEVAWDELTSTFIIGYEEFLARRGLCRNSTSFYMRNLRSTVNRAAEQGFKVPHNPFRHVYMGVDKTVKRAVSLDTVRRIRDLDLSGHSALDFARNVFMFSFYTRGMSFVDMAFLRKSDMCDDVITYCRRKTRQQIRVKIEPETRKLMNTMGESGSSYLLPIITDDAGDTEKQYLNAYYRVNRSMSVIGEMLGLGPRLTLYVARHTWASIAHDNNVALGTISRAMGHDSESTTLIYLQSLDTSLVDRANSDIIRLMNGRKKKCGK